MKRDSERWKPNRIIFFNYWYFPNEEYKFRNGRLLIKGHNGAGKSVAMNTVFTFLIDGNKDPKRLDPFESSDRKFYDILLGEESLNKDITERIGYVVVEYKLGDKEEYMTTGIGMHAKRKNRKMEDAWGFVIPNRRINKGKNSLSLYTAEMLDGSFENIPKDRKQFTNDVGDSGNVVDLNQYAKHMNDRLFGFPDESGLKLYTDVLVRLKSPKLTKGGGPDDLKDTLNHSLPSLTEQELSALTTTVQAQDQTQREIVKTQADLSFAVKLDKGYDDYVSYVFADKAKHFLDYMQELQNVNAEYDATLAEIADKTEAYNAAELQIQAIKSEIEGLKEARSELKHEEVSNLEDALNSAKNTFQKLEGDKIDKSSRFDNKKQALSSEQDVRRKIEDELWEIEKEMKALLENLEEIAYDTSFSDIYDAFIDHYKRHENEGRYDFYHWETQTRIRLQQLESLQKQWSDYEQKKRVLTDMREQIGEKQTALDAQRQLRSDQADQYDRERNNSYVEVETWIKELNAFTLSVNSATTVKRMMNGYLESVTEEEMFAPILRERDEQISNLQLAQVSLASQKQAKMDEKSRAEQEKAALEASEEIEPELPEPKQKQIAELKATGIPFVPFYAAVEFKQSLSDEQKSRLESVLAEAGILTSLIVPAPYQGAAQTQAVQSSNNPATTNNLTQYFDVASGDEITEADVLAVLKGISISDTDAHYVSDNGAFKGSFVFGTAPHYGVAKYIGKHAREQERLRKIASLLEKIAGLDNEIARLQTDIDESKVIIGAVEEEFRRFPKFAALKDAKRKLETIVSYIADILEPDIVRLNDKFKEQKTVLDALLAKINSEFESLSVDRNEQAIYQECQNIGNFRSALTNMKSARRSYFDKQTLLENQDEKIQEIGDAIEEARGAVLALDGQLKSLTVRIDSYETQLKEMDADGIRELAKSIADKLDELPNVLSDLNRSFGELDNALKTLKDRLPLGEQKKRFLTWFVGAWEKALLQDVKEFGERLGLPLDADSVSLATVVMQKFGNLLTKKDRVKIKSDMGAVFGEADKGLPEYNLSMEPVEFELDAPELTADQNSLCDILMMIAKREKVTLEYQARRVSPNYSKTKLEERDKILADVMAEKDIEIYEDILINHVGEIIKGKIRNAKEWVLHINEIMERTQISSGLKFDMVWSPKSNPNEDELDTADLMRILEKDPVLLSDTDRKKVAQHFRSKVHDAKRKSELSGTSSFIEDIMKVLDYRDWYQFIIYYTKTGEPRREMKKSNFNTFSGGERAMAMYTPLLAAVDARLQNARPNAPRIFALDEAFAGVDEKNIREAFKVIESYDFDYTLNSQAIWATFEEVPDLSIIVLSRLGNANVVMSTAYTWNGIRKLPVDESQEEPEDNSESFKSQIALF
ncbi:TIGR02680 family protein [Paenibacillus sp. RC67]|uniref:TIGR02680 family protein n=1 Tax=Paenibacillus sp. RC67 TaxID=3039392 RepID=UPI0024AD6A3F|nr:TIGR02680 family protein [Paenibacillus sp. RC67]